MIRPGYVFICVSLCFLLAQSDDIYADIYKWVDANENVNYSDKNPRSDHKKIALGKGDPVKPFVKLSVPQIKQDKMLCGPATIEMLLKYWGVDDYDQYDIAYNILLQSQTVDRYVKSGVLSDKNIDWKKYPGTGTLTMRKFLRKIAPTLNPKVRSLPADSKTKRYIFEAEFDKLKDHLSNKIPVIVHQYWKGKGTFGHYRLVTGYDDEKKLIYLNDAGVGKEITQTYDQFLEYWNVDREWLHYNALVFNVYGQKIIPRLERYKYL